MILEIMGLFFAIVMFYFTYSSFKRKEFLFADFIIWSIVWVGFSLVVMFPESISFFIRKIGFISVVQLLSILGIMFIFVIVFYLYKVVRKCQFKIDKLVREVALRNKNEK